MSNPTDAATALEQIARAVTESQQALARDANEIGICGRAANDANNKLVAGAASSFRQWTRDRVQHHGAVHADSGI